MEGRCRAPWPGEPPGNPCWCLVQPGRDASSDGAAAVLLCSHIACDKAHSCVAELSHYQPSNGYEIVFLIDLMQGADRESNIYRVGKCGRLWFSLAGADLSSSCR